MPCSHEMDGACSTTAGPDWHTIPWTETVTETDTDRPWQCRDPSVAWWHHSSLSDQVAPQRLAAGKATHTSDTQHTSTTYDSFTTYTSTAHTSNTSSYCSHHALQTWNWHQNQSTTLYASLHQSQMAADSKQSIKTTSNWMRSCNSRHVSWRRAHAV